jgi:hypothetical protein
MRQIRCALLLFATVGIAACAGPTILSPEDPADESAAPVTQEFERISPDGAASKQLTSGG